jgi:hypothetical protein
MSTDIPGDQPARRWQPLSSVQRRVVGVLVEKAKTTPDSYPLTLNTLTSGCNQKSNRDPHMELSPEDVEQALEELRELGAVAEVQGGGRVSKYRHYMYEWLGVDKVELAVMAELLLRGEQTIGELRGRAARMEPIADLNELRPILESLEQKELVVALTPAGRGQVVTHNLYKAARLEELKTQYASGRHSVERTAATSSSGAGAPSAVSTEDFALLQEEVAQLRAELSELRSRLERLTGI